MKTNSRALAMAMAGAWFVGWGVGAASAQSLVPSEPLAPAAPLAVASSGEESIVQSASQVLDEVMAMPGRAIPAWLLADAEGIAIVPGLVKGGFVIGVRHGKGVAVVRDEHGAWQAPVFISITGGSIGWQAGIQATDVVLVFKTKKSVRGLMSGKFTLGADAAAAAGPVGRQAQAATDARLQAEIYSYSRSRGLFAGVALDGSVMQIDGAANAAYYAGLANAGASGQPQLLPASAVRLMEQVARYSTRESAAPLAEVPAHPAAAPLAALPPVVQEPAPTDAAALRRELGESFARLAGLLDDTWKNFLLPPGYGAAANPPTNAASMPEALRRFDAVAADPQYQSLAQRVEFQRTHLLLRQLVAVENAPAPLSLPPPPSGTRN